MKLNNPLPEPRVISGVYDSTDIKQRGPKHRPWHNPAAKFIQRHTVEEHLALPRYEPGLRVVAPKQRSEREFPLTQLHPRWGDILRCMLGTHGPVNITGPVEGGADVARVMSAKTGQLESLNDKISAAVQSSMTRGTEPVKTAFMRKLDADLVAGKRKLRELERQSDGLVYSGPACPWPRWAWQVKRDESGTHTKRVGTDFTL